MGEISKLMQRAPMPCPLSSLMYIDEDFKVFPSSVWVIYLYRSPSVDVPRITSNPKLLPQSPICRPVMCAFSIAIMDLSYPFDQSCRTISQSSPHWAANIFIKALRKGSSLSMLFTQRLRPCEYFLCKLNFF